MFLFARCLHLLVKIFLKVKNGLIKLMFFRQHVINDQTATGCCTLDILLLIFSFSSTIDKHFESTFE